MPVLREPDPTDLAPDDFPDLEPVDLAPADLESDVLESADRAFD